MVFLFDSFTADTWIPDASTRVLAVGETQVIGRVYYTYRHTVDPEAHKRNISPCKRQDAVRVRLPVRLPAAASQQPTGAGGHNSHRTSFHKTSNCPSMYIKVDFDEAALGEPSRGADVKRGRFLHVSDESRRWGSTKIVGGQRRVVFRQRPPVFRSSGPFSNPSILIWSSTSVVFASSASRTMHIPNRQRAEV
ncbi:uncharacterized protein LY79DRAFT_25026 [Colletotrichum navitas]|uniref:Uncharacterized protein n=1 Tax=Colletotrichum navitas TaxID=681940 RepID=A0AAD8QDE2_9PEZI|nr:uncharacterized protein LY79DRAFT_25026 [Colletotrichum navitas]KAK1600593.1 hypothetical protein LY79DRAFT_25026 [Colletotrichum navitas]